MKFNVALSLLLALLLLLSGCSLPDNTVARRPDRYLAGEDDPWLDSLNAAYLLRNRVTVDAGTQTTLYSDRFRMTLDGSALARLESAATENPLLTEGAIVSYFTGGDGRIYRIGEGETQTVEGLYFAEAVTQGQTATAAGLADEAENARRYNLSGSSDYRTFSALTNQVTTRRTDNGMRITTTGTDRPFFGGTGLKFSIDETGANLIRITLRGTGFQGLEIAFATDRVSVSELTTLTTEGFSLSEEEFLTISIPADSRHWQGVLQTLRIQLTNCTEGAWAEVSRISFSVLSDTAMEGDYSSGWRMYAQDLYYRQHIAPADAEAGPAVTELRLRRDGYDAVEIGTAEGFFSLWDDQIPADGVTYVGFYRKDGVVFGIILPPDGSAALTHTEGEDTVLSIRWTGPDSGFRLYAGYDSDFSALRKSVEEEYAPLKSADFGLSDGIEVTYDFYDGVYRAEDLPKKFSIRAGDGRQVYLEFSGTPALSLSADDGTPLPLPAQGGLFPLSVSAGLTGRLSAQAAVSEALQWPLADGIRTQRRLLAIKDSQRIVTRDSDPAGMWIRQTEALAGDGYEFYRIEYTFRQETTLEDLRRTLTLAVLGAGLGTVALEYTDPEGNPAQKAADADEETYLGAMPTLLLTSEAGACSYLIPQLTLTQRGGEGTANLLLRRKEGGGLGVYAEGSGEIIPGDTLHMDLIRLPDGTDMAQMAAIRTNGNLRGGIQMDVRQTADLTATGLPDRVLIFAEGFLSFRPPEITADGAAVTSLTPYIASDGTYGFAFAVPRGAQVHITQ